MSRLRTRLSRLEREHASKSGVNGIAPLEVLVQMLQDQEREAAEALGPPLEDLVAMLQDEEREGGHPIERGMCAENEYPENAP